MIVGCSRGSCLIAAAAAAAAGSERDARAAERYGCQVREVLRQATGEEVYIRPGPYWYRNVAFGKGEWRQ